MKPNLELSKMITWINGPLLTREKGGLMPMWVWKTNSRTTNK